MSTSKEELFIAVRYNARNERMDFALIRDGKRVFGYDNLKEWHCHPSADPSQHIPCAKPSVDQFLKCTGFAPVFSFANAG
jgi:hypothetical protein